MRYGALIAIKPIKRVNGRTVWLFKCDCGNEKNIISDLVRRGNTKSCGCLHRYKDRSQAAKYEFYKSYESGAKYRKLLFALTEEEFHKIVEQNCSYCGCPPETIRKKGDGNYIHNGVDRVDNSKDYIITNVVPCCGTCNIMKKKLSVEKFLSHSSKIHDFNLQKGGSLVS